MNCKTTEAGNGLNRSGFQNQCNRGRNQKVVSVFDSNRNRQKSQEKCEICNSPIQEKQGKPNLCADCLKKSKTLATALFGHLAKPRRVIPLQKCAGCEKCLAASKFSIYRAVCKKCVSDAKEKSKLGQSNFIERTINNVRKNLKGALCQ